MLHMEKTAVTGKMVVRAYTVLERAVEDGFRRGWRRAHKHTDTPAEQHIEDEVLAAIMGEICEVFNFPDDAAENELTQ